MVQISYVDITQGRFLYLIDITENNVFSFKTGMKPAFKPENMYQLHFTAAFTDTYI